MSNKHRLFWTSLVLALLSLNAQAALPTEVSGRPVTSLAPLVEAATPAVVNIRVTQERRGVGTDEARFVDRRDAVTRWATEVDLVAWNQAVAEVEAVVGVARGDVEQHDRQQRPDAGLYQRLAVHGDLQKRMCPQ